MKDTIKLMDGDLQLVKQFVWETLRRKNDGRRRLRVFDFDDTLVVTDARVHVTNKTKNSFSLSPSEYATYEPKPGDKFDFNEFERLINPREITWTGKILRSVYKKHGSTGLVILTARGTPDPIQQFLDSIGITDIPIVTLNSNDPFAKSNWIAGEIENGDVGYVEFFDDSSRNVAAVAALKSKYPGVTIRTRHIIHK